RRAPRRASRAPRRHEHGSFGCVPDLVAPLAYLVAGAVRPGVIPCPPRLLVDRLLLGEQPFEPDHLEELGQHAGDAGKRIAGFETGITLADELEEGRE